MHRENGIASRDMRYKIQKWNVNSEKVHPILVANARVDWMYLDDSDITQQFEILHEGILRLRCSQPLQESFSTNTQVSTHYPHLHRLLDDSIASRHFEDPARWFGGLTVTRSVSNRMLLKPPLIALADGFDNGWAPTGREPNVQGVPVGLDVASADDFLHKILLIRRACALDFRSLSKINI